MHHNLNIHDSVDLKKLIDALTDVVPPVRYMTIGFWIAVCILVYLEFFLNLLLAVKWIYVLMLSAVSRMA